MAVPESSAFFSISEFEETPCLAILDTISLDGSIQYPSKVMESRAGSFKKISDFFKFGV